MTQVEPTSVTSTQIQKETNRDPYHIWSTWADSEWIASSWRPPPTRVLQPTRPGIAISRLRHVGDTHHGFTKAGDTMLPELQEWLHKLHSVVKTKSLARSYVRWPGIDGQIRRLAVDASTPFTLGSGLPSPWQRIPALFGTGCFSSRLTPTQCGPRSSKWNKPDIKSAKTVDTPRTLFRTHGPTTATGEWQR